MERQDDVQPFVFFVARVTALIGIPSIALD
jgi:hypothetical protein